MKVLFDTNIWLSYILAPEQERSVTRVVAICLSSDNIELIVPQEQIAEFIEKATKKRYFLTRIVHSALGELIEQLTAMATQQLASDPYLAYSRDPKDDYLVAYGVLNDADCLVTGDKDLLVLHQVGSLRILTPREFLDLLNNS
jgi:putative PIN family toxin of toxin-antitoxin system